MLLLTATTASVLVGGVAAHAVYQPRSGYSSSVVLSFDQTAAVVTAGDPGILAKLSTLRLTYRGLVSTATIAVPVSQRTGFSPATVASAVTATVPPLSFLLVVSATMPRAADAQRLAAAVGDEVVSYATAQQGLVGVPPEDQYTVSVATPATVAKQLPTHPKRAAAAGIAAFVLTLLVVLGGLVAAEVVLRRRSPEQ